MNSTDTRKATTPQHDLIRTLLIELGEVSPLGVRLADDARVKMNAARFEARTWDFDMASGWISALKALKGDARADRTQVEAPKVKVELPEVPAGSYAVEIDGTVKFYKIEVSKTGFVKGYVQASDDLHRLPFPVLVAVLNKIVEVTPLEASKAYGREIGACGKCGRTLTDASSIAAGIGPICAGKLA